MSKQIDQINKQKIAKEAGKAKPTGHQDLKKAKSQTSFKTMVKKPILNIEIEDDYLEAEESLNQQVRIEGLGLGADFSQQNVMESFRNYQQRKQKQAHGQQPVIDVTQNFQSVSSKNGTQNFDFGALTGGRSAQGKNFTSNKGGQPSSRRHAHGTNRYNKNGFTMVSSSSMDSSKQGSGRDPTQSRSMPPKNEASASDDHSPLCAGNAAAGDYDMTENKTVEQHERINRELARVVRN